MAHPTEFPQISLRTAAPYIVVIMVTYAALVQTTVAFMPELETYAAPLLRWGFGGIFVQSILSTKMEWHFEVGGSPFYLCVGNVIVQHVAVPVCTALMIKGWYDRVNTGTTTWTEIIYAEWGPSSYDDDEWYWEQTITWCVLCMLLKDLPWLLATVATVPSASLVFAHHIGCIIGGLLCIHFKARGARMMAPGFTIAMELGSAFYTYIAVYPDHPVACTSHFYFTTLSNGVGLGLYILHLFYTCEMFTAWWWFMTLVGPIVIGIRQVKTFALRQNYRATGNSLKKTILEKVK